VVLEGMTVAPRAETSGQAKWITWTIHATGMRAPGGTSTGVNPVSKPTPGKSATGPADTTGRAAA
jgi:hypothetical protein